MIGFKIKKLREQNNITQPELAHRLGISQATLCNVENGETKKIDFLLMDKICKEFNVAFDYFIDDKQVNEVKENNGGVVGINSGTINNFPENLIEQIKVLVEHNKQKDLEIESLKSQLNKK